ncbi:DNA repair protein RecN [Sulfurimicrobium lacus]|uniref:DNA repair protein RecN n=1 Tax=Sulfurimicrobium lacus TaxID=2715678 RepID=A0A6F8VGP0_9PROT|nr:DNA repair protein RecN [Sulfurimicrobium lacus]BCB28331.1 DNA repair protein RecN [Sulfurimicrobium lacus]
MLLSLSIRDFVIVDRLELEFSSGFTVLTGETGAGKSILIDALALVLGERGDAGVVRAGCERAELAAEFDIGKLPQLQSWLDENDLAGDPGVCLMRRSIDATGRSRAFVNGNGVTLQQMREAGEYLVDIHGQHAHQSLLKPALQRDLLDAYAGQVALAREVALDYRGWQGLRERRVAWEKDSVAALAELEQLEWQVRELQGLDLGPEEWPELQAEHARLAHAASLLESAQFGVELLADGDLALLSQLNGLIGRLNKVLEYDAALGEPLAILDSSAAQMQEAAYSLRHYAQRLDLDPERLREVEQRIEALHGMARKYRVMPEALPALLQEREERLAGLQHMGSAAELRQQEDAAREVYLAKAAILSEERRRAAQELSARVSEAMQQLAMAGGCFEVALHVLEEGDAHGLERVELLVSAHSSLAAKPLAKVASGGELSRISLAIQVMTSKVAAVPTLIFDEVDVGIGGGVAEVVGKMLRGLGAERQVLCITHLPQVAALGDQHWQVAKCVRDGQVLSQISLLEHEQRIEEIARMLGGVEITSTTRRHAAEMLGVS